MYKNDVWWLSGLWQWNIERSTGKPTMEAIQLRISAIDVFKIINNLNPGLMENILFHSKHTQQAKICSCRSEIQ